MINNYPETIDLPSYIPGYESYCEEIEKESSDNTDEFTEEDDRRIDEFRLTEVFHGEINL